MLYIIISFIAVDHSWAHVYDRCPCDPLDQSGPPTSESHLMNGRDLALLFHIGTLIINNRCLIRTNIILELIQAETNLYTIVTTSFFGISMGLFMWGWIRKGRENTQNSQLDLPFWPFSHIQTIHRFGWATLVMSIGKWRESWWVQSEYDRRNARFFVILNLDLLIRFECNNYK